MRLSVVSFAALLFLVGCQHESSPPDPPGAAHWLHSDTLAVCRAVHYDESGRGRYLGDWVSPEQRAFMGRTGFTERAGLTTPRSVHPEGKVKMVCRRYVQAK